MPPRKKRGAQKQKSEDEEQQINPTSLTVAQLKAELTKKKLDTSGKKAELVKRLQEALDDAPPPTKKAAVEETDQGLEEEVDEKKTAYGKAADALKKSSKKKREPKVDTHIPWHSNYSVWKDYDCMLNQTNIGQNNNKFYVIQMLLNKSNGMMYVWTRWGRVGEPGQNAMKGPIPALKMEEAVKEFEKKFKDKTKNDWKKKANFQPQPGKYTLIDMGDEGDEDEEEVPLETEETDAPPTKVKPCTLEKPTETLVKLLFDHDMFRDAMKSMDIDTKKMPLGKLSKPQIAKGFEALEQLEAALHGNASRSKLSELSSKFYTIIPHDFGRRIPPVIDNQEMLQKKFDMLMVLGDIEIAQTIQKDKKAKPTANEVPHPLDLNYQSLKAELVHVKKTDDDYKIIQKYLDSTQPSYQKLEILDVWRVDREGEGDRFAEHSTLGNRKLLWHGTNVAVVAAILKSGLRIMPHSGGRVGRGIYFASENSKSAGYVRCTGSTGIMLLNEIALGKEHEITKDDPSLRKAPQGFDCVVAKGRTEPDPKHDITLKMDSKDVVIPQGKPVPVTKYNQSYFSQSEYLIYKESQVRMRYLLKLKFGGYSW